MEFDGQVPDVRLLLPDEILTNPPGAFLEAVFADELGVRGVVDGDDNASVADCGRWSA